MLDFDEMLIQIFPTVYGQDSEMSEHFLNYIARYSVLL